jgi:DNA-binding HxlR family transcriptional regulator
MPTSPTSTSTSTSRGDAPHASPPGDCHCCPRYHEAVELVGKRWTGAILYVLLHGGRLRFTQIAQAVPDLSDRLLSERMKELERRGIVVRHVSEDTPVKVCYELTEKGTELAPALAELKTWADRWLD